MAAVVPALISAVAAGSFATAGAGLVIGFSVKSFVSSLVLSGLSKAIAPKSKPARAASSSTASITTNGYTTTIKQPILTREVIYGEVRAGGGIIFIGSSNGNEFLHVVIQLAGHEITSVGEVWLDDYSIPEDALDVNGNVTSGRYSGLVRIKKHLGTSSQTADANLVSEVSEWTTDHRLRGVAYLYLRLKWDQDKFANGLPNISAWIRGKKILDTRSSSTSYSNNVALCVNDYLVDQKYGFSASQSEIDTTFLNAAANKCDEFVTTTDYPYTISNVNDTTDIITLSSSDPILFYQTGDRVQLTTTGTLPSGLATVTDYYVIAYQRKDTLRIKLASTYAAALSGNAIDITSSGSGTHTITKKAEPRYSGGIILDSSDDLKSNTESLLSGMAGKMVYAGGRFNILAGSFQTPSVTFTISDIISEINVQTKVSSRERFNTVRGKYVSQVNDGQPSDFPQVTNSTYRTEDQNQEIVKQIDLPFTQRPHTAQRIAKIELEKSRQEISFSCDFNLNAFQVQAGDTCYITIDRFGWSSKVFEITSWKLASREENGVFVPFINMSFRETASGVYDWNSGEETSVDIAPNTSLPDIFTVAPITGLGIDSEQVFTQGGDYVYKIMGSWNEITDQLVLKGGKIEIQFKRSADLVWRPTFTVPAETTFAEITLAAELNDEYDIRLRAVNQVGVRSNYTTILNFVVGSSGGVTSTEDWGDFVSSPTESEDWGDFVSSPTESDDWGFYT